MMGFITMISPIFRTPRVKPYQGLEKQSKAQPPKKSYERKKLSPHRNYITYDKQMKIKDGLNNSSFDLYR